MRRAIALALVFDSSVTVDATKCAAGNVHKNDLTNLFCATSATDAASCDSACCTQPGKAGASTTTPTCGSAKPVCNFGTYAAGDDAWKNTKTTTKAAQQQIDCCKPVVTCDNTLYTCPAGYKKTSTAANKKMKCPGGPKSCGVAGTCCELDLLTCGGYKASSKTATATAKYKAVTCPTPVASFETVPGTDDAWKKTKFTKEADTAWQAACCDLKPTCASITCKTGQIFNTAQKSLVLTKDAKGKFKEQSTTKDVLNCDGTGTGTGATCKFCCMNDKKVNTCGVPNTAITCPGGTYFPSDGSYNNVIIASTASQNSVCCVPTATCAAAVCPAGQKKKANVDTLSCHGSHTSCNTICCENDKTTCGGIKATSGLSCAYGTYDESATWTLSGDKKTCQATKDAWNGKKTTAATKNTDCCTAAASCKKEPIGTTTPAAAAVTTTPAAPIRRYSENDVTVEENSNQGMSPLALVGAGAFAGMAVLMGVQGFRSKSSPREVLIDSEDSFSE